MKKYLNTPTPQKKERLRTSAKKVAVGHIDLSCNFLACVCGMWHVLLTLLLLLISREVVLGEVERVRVSTVTSTFRDSRNRTLLFHGTNCVKKVYPFYPSLSDENVTDMKGDMIDKRTKQIHKSPHHEPRIPDN